MNILKIYQLEQQCLELVNFKNKAIQEQKYEEASALRDKEISLKGKIVQEQNKLLDFFASSDLELNTLNDFKRIARYIDPLNIHNFLENRIKTEIEKTENLINTHLKNYQFSEANSQRERLVWIKTL